MMKNIKVNEEIKELIKQCDTAWIKGDIKLLKLTGDLLLEKSEKNSNKEGIISSYNALGLCYNRFGNFDIAMEYFYKAVDVSREIGDNEKTAIALMNVGMTYGGMGSHQHALKFNLAAIDLEFETCVLHTNIGYSYQALEKYDEAIEHYLKSYDIALKDGNQKIAAVALMHMGTVYAKQNNIERSNKNFQQAYDIAVKLGDLFQIGGILLQQTKNQRRMGNLNNALELCDQALENVNKQDNDFAKKSIYEEMAKLHELKEDFKQACYYRAQQVKLSEKLFNQKISEKISNIQVKYELELQDKEKKRLQLQNAKNEVEIKLERFKKAYSNVTGIGKVGIFSHEMQEIVKLSEFFHKDRNVPVLIEGETGTGKEIISRMVHYGEEKSNQLFIIVNCSAITSTLFESELFGYEEGAFTGAKSKGMIGKFELAQGGTLFLDEIGDLPLELQPKLLRVLQQKEIYRIGGNKPINLNVRIICATNRDLQAEIVNGNFRRDLYYRLNTGRIFIPPLRDRSEEIGPLAQIFLTEFAQQKSRSFKYISSETVKLLEAYNWPGNVRELRNAIERAVLIYDDIELKPEHLSFLSNINGNQTGKSDNQLIIDFPDEGLPYSQIERMVLKKGLEICQGNKSKLASFLKISTATIFRKKL